MPEVTGSYPPGAPCWVDALVRAGGTVLEPPYDMVAGRMAVVQDPQGAAFAVLRPAPMNQG